MDAFEILRDRGFLQQCTDEDALKAALSAGSVTFYVGFDPTADSLHVGHLLPVMAMRWMQQCGHRPIAIVGGGTAMVGDPSGKTELRQMLTREQIVANTNALKAQLSHFLSFEDGAGLLVDNADWLLDLSYIQFLRDIGRHFSVNRMLSAEAYKMRLERGLSFIEFNYQLLQAYDFLELNRRYGCTLQMGGDDQWGNILAGTDLVRRIARADVHGLTQPLITTATGAKMGKSAAGAVWLDPARLPPFDYYQYWLNVDDRDVGRFLKLYTALPLDEIARYEALQGADIREGKARLAWESTALVHGAEAADQAAAAGRAMVSATASEDLPTHSVSEDAIAQGLKVAAVLADAGLCKSRSDARRQIEGGAVRVNGEKVSDPELNVDPTWLAQGDVVLRVGKKRAARLMLG